MTDCHVKGGAPLRVLLADDEPDIRLVARIALTREGFDVVVAGTGAAVLSLASERTPDVIVLDWMMPEMDGPETCARLKADPSTRDIPVVFLTAQSDRSERQRGLALGAVGYITKPFDVVALGPAVRQILASHVRQAPATPSAGRNRGVNHEPERGRPRPPARLAGTAGARRA